MCPKHRESKHMTQSQQIDIFKNKCFTCKLKKRKKNLIPRLPASLNLGSGQQVICPASRLLYQVVFPVAFCTCVCECLDEPPRRTVTSARARFEETVRVLLSFLLQRSCSEPRLAYSLLLSLAPSSWNIEREESFLLSHPLCCKCSLWCHPAEVRIC